ncbi:MAG: chorismate mutase [Lachnospiraceae bacterium]|nr:chorismate mutase [Lachnospiraceae bacterium]MBO7632406.1 chorismate mutase [Lachnospiraceae bacterium]
MKTLEECRMELDKLDSQIVDLLTRRIYVTNAMAQTKKSMNLPVYDQMREELLRRRVRQLAGTEYEEIVAAVYETVITESKKQQMQRYFE